MKKWMAGLGLAIALTAPAPAWQPAGWVYFSWPYAYHHETGDWYYFAQRNEQWTHHLTGAGGWRKLPQTVVATGWSWHSWPYVYSRTSRGWYNFAAARGQWCVRLGTGSWEIFGMPPAPVNMAVIPGGTKEGVDPDFGAYRLSVDAFFLSQIEIAKGIWNLHVNAYAAGRGYADLPAGAGKHDLHPVVGVNWYDCVKFCNLLSELAYIEPVYYQDAAFTQVYRTGEIHPYVKPGANGYRLPKAEEWEYAARGRQAGRRFPWGNTITHGRANYQSDPIIAYDENPNPGYHPTYAVGDEPYTAPVSAFPPGDYGLRNMAGNAWEWCFDWHPDHVDAQRVLRGGGWREKATFLRIGLNHHYWPANRYYSVGFRTARGP